MIYGIPRNRWSILLAAMAAVIVGAIAAGQGVSLETIGWRGLVSFGMVWSFQWSLLTAWEILGDETGSTRTVPVRPDGA